LKRKKRILNQFLYHREMTESIISSFKF